MSSSRDATTIAALSLWTIVPSWCMHKAVMQTARLCAEHTASSVKYCLAPGGAKATTVGENCGLWPSGPDRPWHHSIGSADAMLVIVQPLVGWNAQIFESRRTVGQLPGLLVDRSMPHEEFKPRLFAHSPVQVRAVHARACGIVCR